MSITLCVAHSIFARFCGREWTEVNSRSKAVKTNTCCIFMFRSSLDLVLVILQVMEISPQFIRNFTYKALLWYFCNFHVVLQWTVINHYNNNEIIACNLQRCSSWKSVETTLTDGPLKWRYQLIYLNCCLSIMCYKIRVIYYS